MLCIIWTHPCVIFVIFLLYLKENQYTSSIPKQSSCNKDIKPCVLRDLSLQVPDAPCRYRDSQGAKPLTSLWSCFSSSKKIPFSQGLYQEDPLTEPMILRKGWCSLEHTAGDKSHGCWELKSGPQQKQHIHSATSPAHGLSHRWHRQSENLWPWGQGEIRGVCGLHEAQCSGPCLPIFNRVLLSS